MAYVSPDRWTCPTCLETETPNAGEGAAMHRAIRRVQLEHGTRHAGERTRAAKREARKLAARVEAGGQ